MAKVALALALALCLLPCSSLAAEQTVTASFTTLMEEVEEILLSQGVAVEEQAQTDRFAIFYLTRESGGGATVSLYMLPQQDTRVTITVHSDSPADPLFDRSLLRQLTDTGAQAERADDGR